MKSWDVFDYRYKPPRVKKSHLALMKRMAEQVRSETNAAPKREDVSPTASAE